MKFVSFKEQHLRNKKNKEEAYLVLLDKETKEIMKKFKNISYEEAELMAEDFLNSCGNYEHLY